MKRVNDYDKKDILNYWLSLFPEFDNFEQLVKHIENMLQVSVEECTSEQYDRKERSKNNDADQSLSINEEQKKQVYDGLKKDSVLVPVFLLYQDIIYKHIGKLLYTINLCDIIEDKNSFTESILEQINRLMEPNFIRVFILEIHSARENGTLLGKNSTERYEYFVNDLITNKGYRDIFFEEYKTLYNISVNIITDFCNYLIEIMSNTKKEFEHLNKLFSAKGCLGKIYNIKISVGDTHCNGRSVAIIHFKEIKLVYKPRNMRIDIQFQKCLAWINKKAIIKELYLSTVKIHAVDNYGWMEFIEQKECGDEIEAEKFYLRSGLLLGILYCFNAKDFHYENIIAHGEFPVLIDLETLFHVRIKDESNEKGGIQAVEQFLNQSVEKIGLLPSRMNIRKDNKIKSIDVGALSHKENQKNILKSLVLKNVNTDYIAMDYEYLSVEDKKNMPKISNLVLEPGKYKKHIIEGFTKFYMFAVKNKQELDDILIRLFFQCQIRIILKSTMSYSSLLNIATHPDFMRDAVHRDVLLSRIGTYQKHNSEIKRFELSELCRNQIPYFYTTFDSTVLKGYPSKIFEHVIEKSAADYLKDKLSVLTESDCKIQTYMIQNTYFTRNPGADVTDLQFSDKYDKKIEPLEYLRLSEAIADCIINRSCIGLMENGEYSRAYWGAQVLNTEVDDWSAGIDTLDLYDGSSGIALFFLNLWQAGKNEKYLQYAYETVHPIIHIVSQRKSKKISSAIGAYKGLGGVVYVMNRIGLSTGHEKAIKTVYDLMEIIQENIKEDVNYDFISGGIGCLAALLAIYKNPADIKIKPKIQALCLEIYDNIRGKFCEDKQGKRLNIENERISSGFAHGTSGILPYLYKLYKITNNKEILDLVQDILLYERSTLLASDAVKGHGSVEWHSSLTKAEEDVSWCNGVVGILLGKAMLKSEGYMDELLDNEIEVAYHKVKDKSLGHNLTYCHGDLSVLSVMRYYAELREDKELECHIQSLSHKLFSSLINNWMSDKRSINKYNGLMLGLAGLGFAAIKQYAGENTDEFLWLD